MKIKKECFFCNKPGKFYPGITKNYGFYRIRCNCWKVNSNIHEAWTYYYDGEICYGIQIKNPNINQDGKDFYHFDYQSKENMTYLVLASDDNFPNPGAWFLINCSGQMVNLENCYEKLQKYMPFI